MDMHRQHLTEANRHIATGLDLIAKQRDLVDLLERDGHNSSEAQKLLWLFEETMELMRAHRELIRWTIDRRP